MTKPRAPLSLEAALTRVADKVDGGWNGMAEITRHSPGHVRSWADPDRREEIPLVDALALDVACAAAGQETPLFTWFAARLEAAHALAPIAPRHLVMHAATVASETGDAVSAIIGAAQSCTCKATALKEVDEAIAALTRARTALAGLPDRPHAVSPAAEPAREPRTAATPISIPINRAAHPPINAPPGDATH